MFVVRRPFRNFGKVYTAGTVITEPAAIKRFKGKFAEGKIIEVTEQNYNDIAKYFKSKYGVDIPKLTEETIEEVDETAEEVEEPTEEVDEATEEVTEEVEEKPKKAVAKAKVASSK